MAPTRATKVCQHDASVMLAPFGEAESCRSVATIVAARRATTIVVTGGSGPSLVHRDGPAAHVGAGELVDGLAGIVVGHFHEAEASRTARFPISDDLRGGNRTDRAEQAGQLVRSS